MNKFLETAKDHFIKEHKLRDSKKSLIDLYTRYLDKEDFTREGTNFVKLKYRNSPVKAVVDCKGLVYGMSGFAQAMRNIALNLNKQHINVSITPLDEKNSDIASDNETINSLCFTSFISKLPQVRISMTHPMGVKRKLDDIYHIGYVMFETVDIPELYINHLTKECDELWVPSSFNVENFKRAGWKKPIYRMPLGVDTEVFDPDKTEPLKPSESIIASYDGYFKFLSIMGWSERKGVSLLIKAFCEAFKNNEKVVLFIKGGWYDEEKARETVQTITKDYSNPPQIWLDFNIYPDSFMPRLYKSADAFVLLSRGEGWGLNYTEAMSMKLPVIGTMTTSMLDFMNNFNSYLVDVDDYVIVPECDWICKEYVGQKFAQPSLRSAIYNLKMVYNNNGLAQYVKDRAREEMIKFWSWDKASELQIARLKEIVKY